MRLAFMVQLLERLERVTDAEECRQAMMTLLLLIGTNSDTGGRSHSKPTAGGTDKPRPKKLSEFPVHQIRLQIPDWVQEQKAMQSYH